jgi:HAMP domain-containing protein
MKLSTKFNLVLLLVLSAGLAGIGWFAHTLLLDNARRQVIDQAGLLMEGAKAVRSYTVGEIKPLLTLQLKRAFLPQSVPAYSATQTFHKMRETHPEYRYKEATLNPTNPRDRAVDWEADIVQTFADDPERTELIGVRDTPTGPSLYLARPIRITNPGCLTCHSTVAEAPKTMLELYGEANGFGWKMDEVIGAQVVSVPMSVPIAQANEAFLRFMAALGGVFLLIVLILNIMLRAIVIRPVTQLSRLADRVSMGDQEAGEFPVRGKDEISVLAASFNRMRRSLDEAFRMLEE